MMKKIALSVLLLIGGVLSQSCSPESKTEINNPKEDFSDVIEVLSHEDSMVLLLPNSDLGVVSDFEDLLSDEEEITLKNKMDAHELETTNEIGIVTVSDFYPYENIDDYSLELFNKWGIGKKDKNNGILITVSKNNHNVRISTGTGMEDILTDSIAFNINNEIMIPFFKENDYFGGINAGLDAVIDYLK